MYNNHKISANNLNLSPPAARECIANSSSDSGSSSRNGISTAQSSNYKDKIFHIPVLPEENSFQNDKKEVQTEIQPFTQQLTCNYKNDQWLKFAPKIIEQANRVKKISFNKKKQNPKTALHKIIQPLTQFKTIAPRQPNHSPESTIKTNSLKNNNDLMRTHNDKGAPNSNRAQERFILPKSNNSPSSANSAISPQKNSNIQTQNLTSITKNQNPAPSLQGLNVQHLTGIDPNENSQVFRQLQPKTNTISHPGHKPISPKFTVTKNHNPTQSNSKADSKQNTGTPTSPTQPCAQQSSPIEQFVDLMDSLTVNCSNDSTSNFSPSISLHSSFDKVANFSVLLNLPTSNAITQSTLPNTNAASFIPEKSLANSQPSPPPSELPSPNSYLPESGQKCTTNHITSNSAIQPNHNQKNYKSSNKPTTSQSSPKPKTADSVIIISDGDNSEFGQFSTSKNLITRKTKPRVDQSAQIKQTPTSSEAIAHKSKSKADQPSKNRPISSASKAVTKKLIPQKEKTSKRLISDKHTSNPRNHSNHQPQDRQSVSKKAKTSSRKDSLPKQTPKPSTLFTDSSNLIQKAIKETKMVCKKSGNKPKRNIQASKSVSSTITQVKNADKDSAKKLEVKTKTYAKKSGPKDGIPKPNKTIVAKKTVKTVTKTTQHKTKRIKVEDNVTTYSVELSKSKEPQLPTPQSTVEIETDSTEVSFNPNSTKPLYTKLQDIPVIIEETEEAPYIDKEFDIECIIGRRLNTGKKQRQYLVKWKGYHVSLSTWVDTTDLNCADLIRVFNLSMESKKGGKTSRIADDTKKEQFLPDELEKFLIILNQDEDTTISVVNDVDNALAPNFTYINNLVLHPEVILDSNESSFIASCNCNRMCRLASNSSAQKSCLESHDPYSYIVDSSLHNLYNKLIYECNSNCNCNLKCTNRVVQRGRNVQLQVFRTKYKGWGVRTLQDIPEGMFVCKYAGLVITSDHAEIIGKEYDQRGSTYLFDLDADTGMEKTQELCIDANSYGNVSRFINHSCSPNLGVYSVVTDSLSVYDLAFFTQRNVKKGEELFIDYSGGVDITDLELKKQASKCYCLTSNCKGYIFM